MARSSVELIVDASKAINPLKRVTAETKKLESSVGKAQSGIRRTNRAFKETGRVAERASKREEEEKAMDRAKQKRR